MYGLVRMFQERPSNGDQALLVVLKVLAHTGNDNFVDVITDICILAVRFFAQKSIDIH